MRYRDKTKNASKNQQCSGFGSKKWEAPLLLEGSYWEGLIGRGCKGYAIGQVLNESHDVVEIGEGNLIVDLSSLMQLEAALDSNYSITFGGPKGVEDF
ncbi:hypothetical protein FNV43_RR13370 [Rhamnella rubrinervis]|uniref:Uncharacterized protein n=1 Tax=Rhamnella rubrinervis TaxID=2594499 RepID=A0A8K0H113_9ROSA|nr:hypothetical protein FNV43_RR13370 [Rhamnella rubrinervis]